MWKVMKVLVLVLCPAIFIPRPARAQCGHFDTCSEGDHKLPQTESSNENPHDYCSACISGICHPVCGGGDFATNPALKKRFEAVVAAANGGDLATVLRLAPGTPGYVLFNPERRTVQLKGCSGQVIIANLPIRSDRMLAMAERLPTTTQLFAVATATSTVSAAPRAGPRQ